MILNFASQIISTNNKLPQSFFEMHDFLIGYSQGLSLIIRKFFYISSLPDQCEPANRCLHYTIRTFQHDGVNFDKFDESFENRNYITTVQTVFKAYAVFHLVAMPQLQNRIKKYLYEPTKQDLEISDKIVLFQISDIMMKIENSYFREALIYGNRV